MFCSLQWLKQSISDFPDLNLPLHDFIDRIYDLTKEKHTEQAESHILFSERG